MTAIVEAGYLANIALACVLMLWPLWFSRRYLQLPKLNPFTIVLAIGLPVQLMKLFVGPLILVEGGLFDPAYQYALLMGSLLVMAQTGGLVFFYRGFQQVRIDRWLPLQRVLLSPNDLRRGATFFAVVCVMALYLLASAQFGVLNWLSNPRTGYQLYREGQGHWYALAISALAMSMLLSFLAHPNARSVLWRAPLFFCLGYFFGSKSMLLTIFTSLLTFLWFLHWRHLTRLLLLGAPVIFALLVWNLYLAITETFDLQAVVEYFDYYKNAADYYREVLAGNIGLYHGEITWSSLWSYVPRSVWPEKPFVYGILIVNEIFFPGQAELTNTPAFGGAVEQFADFGVPGVLAFGFFSMQSLVTALMSYLIFKRPGVRLNKVNLATVVLMIVQFAPGFGTFFPGALYLALLGIVVIILHLLRRSRRARNGAGQRISLTSGSSNSVQAPDASRLE
jgi:hypothetical protein